ncbi:MAG: DPP IV N-terminal domain-containing protein, partial [Anaerolineales bacterium]|nr:DPP IV N-terminal domain-containing protein [Anaerolineales bacterium]
CSIIWINCIYFRTVKKNAGHGPIRGRHSNSDHGRFRRPRLSPLAPDGRELIFHSHLSSPPWVISRVNPFNGESSQLTDGSTLDAGPFWSPDGNQIGFDREGDLWLMDRDGNNQEVVFSSSGMDGHADWSPRGDQIALVSDMDGNPEIYIYSLENGQLMRITDHPGGDWWPDWSPDGRQIVFKSDRDGDFDIYRINVDGTGLTQLTENEVEDGEPDWSPDGSQIAFESNRDGNFEIYTMDSDGKNLQRLTDQASHDLMPSWYPK